MNTVSSCAVIALTVSLFVSSTLVSDSFEGQWTTGPALQLSRQELAVAYFDDLVWVVGGQVGKDSPLTTDTTEVLSLGDAKWTWGPPLPAPRDHVAVAVHGGRLWALGGFDFVGLPQDTVWSIGPGELEWTTETSLPGPIAAAGAASVAGRLLLIGGTTGTQSTAAVWRYREDGTGWEPIASLAVARDHMAIATLGGKVYAIGGRGPSGPTLGTVERYDPGAASWSALADLPTPRSGLAAIGYGGLVWTVGGELPGIFDAVEVYDPAADGWHNAPVLPTARHGMGMAVPGGSLLVPGGADAPFSSPSAVTEALRPDHLFRDGFEMGDTALWSLGIQ